MASDTWRYPWTLHPDYMGEGTPVQQYQKKRAELVTAPPSPAVAALPNIPPRTEIAVANASGTREAEDRGFDPNASQSVQVPKGPVSSPQARAEGYPDLRVRGLSGNSVDLSRSGGLPGITFNSPPAPVAQAAQAVSPNVGLLPPEFHGQIAELLDAAKPLINSKGIVDRLRGRQLLGARDRLIQGASQIVGAAIAGANAQTGARSADAQMLGAQTGAFRASNEVPLALLSSAMQKYGVDVGAETSRGNAALAADTSRYHTDETNATARHGIDMRTAIDLPKAQRDQMVNDALQAGNEGYAGTVATIDRREPAAKISGWVSDGMGRMVRSRHDGKTEMLVTDPKTQKTKIVVVDPDETDKEMKEVVRNAVNR